MPRINLLKKEVYELIAAGEVIDRPSAIVKELLENAIDAGASIITVEIKEGGKSYIRVCDNGCGISREDLPTAFRRHATSKVSTQDDLNTIMTLGFRGEALASVCAVAKVDIITKPKNDALGSHMIIEGSKQRKIEDTGCPDGTTIVVRDLFYNVPARLKFLKSATTEGNAIATVVQKIILSHPDISFKFIRDNKTDIITSGDRKSYSAIYSVFGRDFAKSLIEVEYHHNNIQVSGYISKPLECKGKRIFQNFFINGRYVKSNTCHTALEEAYRNNIMVGKFPACALFLDIDPNTIDVNVHPAKIEIRFSDEKKVYDAVFFAVKNALMKNDTTNVMSIAPKEQPKNLYAEKPQGEQISFENNAVLNNLDNIDCAKIAGNTNNNIDDNTEQSPNISNSEPDGENLFIKNLEKDISSKPINHKTESAQPQEIMQKQENSEFKYLGANSFVKETPAPPPPPPTEKPLKLVGEIFNTYIIVEQGKDVYIIDKHAAHERYIFEQIKSKALNLDSQMLLEPIYVLLGYDEYDALISNLEKAKQFGFIIEDDVAPTVAVTGVPVLVFDTEISELVEQLAKNFLNNMQNPQLEIFDDLLHSIACKAAIKAHDINSDKELLYLAKCVFNEDIRYCPHGRPVKIKLSKYEIEKQFKRII